MQPVFIPTHELFIILEPFKRRFRTIYSSLEPLADAANEGPLLLGADTYYRDETDVALLAIRFDARTMSDRKLSWVLAFCADSHLPVLDPSRLGELDRRSFYEGYLPMYGVCIEQCEGPEEALVRLASELRLEVPGAAGPPSRAAGSAQERTARHDSKSGRYVYHLKKRKEVAALPAATAAPAAEAEEPKTVVAERRRKTAAGPPPIPESPRGKEKRSQRPPTLPASPTARRESQDGSTIHARFLRGDDWVTARLRSISLRGAGVVAGALPRLRDQVRLALAFGENGAMLRGLVVQVSGGSDCESGSVGFRLAFPEEDSPARRRLIALLRRAREAGISLKPPPRRAAMRLPVKWPIRICDKWSDVPAAALDVSSRGFFLATERGLAEEVEFQLPLDEPGQPVVGRARIAREVSARMAGERGLPRGFGLEILEIPQGDQGRWHGFLDRIRRRSERRVAVAAAVGRSADLTAGLAMAGYVAAGRQDPSTVLELVDEGKPPDAVVLDDSLASGRNSRWLRSMIENRGVPCVSLRHERPVQARKVVDRVLAVS